MHKNLQVNDERMPNHEQYVLLVVHVFDLFETNHFGDRQRFQRQILLRPSMPDKNDAAERARTYQRYENISTGQLDCRSITAEPLATHCSAL